MAQPVHPAEIIDQPEPVHLEEMEQRILLGEKVPHVRALVLPAPCGGDQQSPHFWKQNPRKPPQLREGRPAIPIRPWPIYRIERTWPICG